MTTLPSYSHSGRSPFLAMTVSIIIILTLAPVIAYLYSALVFIVPLIYVNLLICAAFGTILGLIARMVCHITKIRNRRQYILIHLTAGVAGFAWQWIAYISLLVSGYSFTAYLLQGFYILQDPAPLFSMLSEIYQYGTYQIAGIMINDIALFFTWLCEGLIIIGIPVMMAYKRAVVPYSELLDRWYGKYILKQEFARISMQNEFKTKLSDSPETAIAQLGYGHANRFTEILIYYLQDEDVQYLSADNVYIDDNGKGKSHRDSIISLYPISNSITQNLMERYGTRKGNVLS